MDPVSAALSTFQEQVRMFQSATDKTILYVVTEAEHRGLLTKTLRMEEWSPKNRSPFIIVDTPWFKNESEQAKIICHAIRDQYAQIVKGFGEDGITLPVFSSVSEENKIPVDDIIDSLQVFVDNTREHLDPPLFCWLPSQIKNVPHWMDVVTSIIEIMLLKGVRFIIATENEKDFRSPFKRWEQNSMVVPFQIANSEASTYFENLFAPPSAGHILGTPSGAAAPDVEPPPRKLQPPSGDSIKEAIASLNLPPMLSLIQAEKLRTALFAAAFAAGRQDEQQTISEQLRACAICEEAGVKLEHALMRLTLANYYLQFELEDEAKREYNKAEMLAAEIPDYSHLAQIRMAQAFVRMRKKRMVEEAIYYYEQAAAAAAIGEVWLLYLESLRMLGTCHLKLKNTDAAMECWQAAVVRTRKMKKGEVLVSSFSDTAKEFINVLEKEGLEEQAESVARLVDEINASPVPDSGSAFV